MSKTAKAQPKNIIRNSTSRQDSQADNQLSTQKQGRDEVQTKQLLRKNDSNTPSRLSIAAILFKDYKKLDEYKRDKQQSGLNFDWAQHMAIQVSTQKQKTIIIANLLEKYHDDYHGCIIFVNTDANGKQIMNSDILKKRRSGIKMVTKQDCLNEALIKISSQEIKVLVITRFVVEGCMKQFVLPNSVDFIISEMIISEQPILAKIYGKKMLNCKQKYSGIAVNFISKSSSAQLQSYKNFISVNKIRIVELEKQKISNLNLHSKFKIEDIQMQIENPSVVSKYLSEQGTGKDNSRDRQIYTRNISSSSVFNEYEMNKQANKNHRQSGRINKSQIHDQQRSQQFNLDELQQQTLKQQTMGKAELQSLAFNQRFLKKNNNKLLSCQQAASQSQKLSADKQSPNMSTILNNPIFKVFSQQLGNQIMNQSKNTDKQVRVIQQKIDQSNITNDDKLQKLQIRHRKQYQQYTKNIDILKSEIQRLKRIIDQNRQVKNLRLIKSNRNGSDQVHQNGKQGTSKLEPNSQVLIYKQFLEQHMQLKQKIFKYECQNKKLKQEQKACIKKIEQLDQVQKKYVQIKLEVQQTQQYLIGYLGLQQKREKKKVENLTFGYSRKSFTRQQLNITEQRMRKQEQIKKEIQGKPINIILKQYVMYEDSIFELIKTNYINLQTAINNGKSIQQTKQYKMLQQKLNNLSYRSFAYRAGKIIMKFAAYVSKVKNGGKDQKINEQHLQKIRQLNQQIDILNEKIKCEHQQNQQLKIMVMTKQNQLQMKNDQVTIANNNIKQVKQKYTAIQSRYNQLKVESQDIQNRHKQAELKLKGQQSKVKQLSNHIKQIENKYQQNMFQKQRQFQSIQQTLRNSILDLQKQKDGIQKIMHNRILALQQQHKSAIQNHQVSLQSTRINYLNQISQLNCQYTRQITRLSNEILNFRKMINLILLNFCGISMDFQQSNCQKISRQFQRQLNTYISRNIFLVESELYASYNKDQRNFLFDSVKTIAGTRQISRTKTLFEGYQGCSWDQWLLKLTNKPNILVVLRLENGYDIAGFSENPFSQELSTKGKGFLACITNQKLYNLKSSAAGKAARHDRFFFVLGNNELLVKGNFSFEVILSSLYSHFETTNVTSEQFIGQSKDEGMFKRVEFHQCFFE